MSRVEQPIWVKKFQAEGTTQQRLKVDGVRYSYTILKEEVARRDGLPYAVAYEPLKNVPLIITENVPENFRRFILAHEIREKNWDKILPEEERCRAALVAELEEVVRRIPDQISEYVEQRLDFFKDLIPYHEGTNTSTPKFIEGLKRSRDLLKEFSSQNPS